MNFSCYLLFSPDFIINAHCKMETQKHNKYFICRLPLNILVYYIESYIYMNLELY